MYKQSLQEELPVRSKKKSTKSNSLNVKLKSGSPIEALSATDLTEISGQINLIEFLKRKLFKSCRKDRKSRLKRKIEARFENLLDIRSFTNVYTNLAILLRVLLTKE